MEKEKIKWVDVDAKRTAESIVAEFSLHNRTVAMSYEQWDKLKRQISYAIHGNRMQAPFNDWFDQDEPAASDPVKPVE